jgi:hypothetical protein
MRLEATEDVVMIRKLNKVVLENTDEKGIKHWIEIEKIMRDKFPKEYSSVEKWRTLWRKHNEEETAIGLMQGTARRDDKRMGRIEDDERLLGLVKRKRRMEFLVERLSLDENTILGLCMQLKLANYNIKVWNEGGIVWVYNVPVIETGDAQIKNLQTSKTIKIAILGDTHIGSKYSAKEELEAFYEYAYQKGVRDFYHTGDMTDGYYKNRDGSIYDQDAFGFQDQIELAVDIYPSIDGCKTYFITGK